MTKIRYQRGVVKKLIRDRGYGFFYPAGRNKPDIFFHMSALKGLSFHDLHNGDVLSFLTDPKTKAVVAVLPFDRNSTF